MKRVIMFTVMIFCFLVVSTTPFWTSGCSSDKTESGESIKNKKVSAKTEAETLVKEWINPRFLVHKGFWYTMRPTGVIEQYKNLRYEVQTYRVTEADKLNGIEWAGHFNLLCTDVYRLYCPKFISVCGNKGWQEWMDCTPLYPGITIYLTKKNGSWKSGLLNKGDAKLKKPAVSNIPKG